jgi:4a-hydroxytetrahydrobiopterin dehydratase
MSARYTDNKVKSALHELNQRLDKPWVLKDGKLHKKFAFADFLAAFAFMTRVAGHAEEFNHHPEWTNVYNRVEFNLMTHDVRGISAKDFRLAEAIEAEYR